MNNANGGRNISKWHRYAIIPIAIELDFEHTSEFPLNCGGIDSMKMPVNINAWIYEAVFYDISTSMRDKLLRLLS